MSEAQEEGGIDALRKLRTEPPQEAVETLEQAKAALPRLTAKDSQLLSELSFNQIRLSDEQRAKKRKAEAEASVRQALAAAEEAAKLDERNADAHLALAVAYGKLAGYVDSRTKLKYSTIIRREAERTLELNPGEDLAHHILGRWHYGIATLNPMMRAMGSALFGKLPQGDLNQAIAHLETAAKIKPDYAPHHRWLAAALEAAGRKEEARPHWETVLRLPVHDPEDRRAHTAARKALRK